MYIVGGHYIDLSYTVDTEEEAQAIINEWIEGDKKEFPGEDTSNDYFYIEINS